MTDLPATLTYFGSLKGISQVLTKSALPLIEANQLSDPFLPDKNTPIPFSVEELFESSVKYITHAVFGRTPPRGQPNHPLQKAIMRWRMENRFSDEAEIREALLGLLPAMVEKAFNQARENHQQWIEFVRARRIVPLFEKFLDLPLWEKQGFAHKGAAVKFKVSNTSIFSYCSAVRYQKKPAITVNRQQYVEHMVGAIPTLEFEPRNILLTQNYALRQLKEWRMVLDHNEHEAQWMDFSTNQIQSVYIGALVSPTNAEQLKNHIARLNPLINVYQLSCKQSEYALDLQKISEEVEESGTDEDSEG